MSMKALTLDSLRELDPKIGLAFNQMLARATQDCYDRPADATPRKIRLEMAIVPVLLPDGQCDQVSHQFFFSAAIPKHRSKVYSAILRPNGAILFNPDSPDNANQATFTNLEDDEDN